MIWVGFNIQLIIIIIFFFDCSRHLSSSVKVLFRISHLFALLLYFCEWGEHGSLCRFFVVVFFTWNFHCDVLIGWSTQVISSPEPSIVWNQIIIIIIIMIFVVVESVKACKILLSAMCVKRRVGHFKLFYAMTLNWWEVDPAWQLFTNILKCLSDHCHHFSPRSLPPKSTTV